MQTKKLEIKLDHLTKKFNDYLAVDDFSLEIYQGDCIGLIGPNGAGKTTLLRMVSGILKENNGGVYFNDQPIEKQRHLIGYLPQYPNFYDWMTAEEVLVFNSKLFGMSNEEIKQRIPEVLELVGLVGCEKRKVTGFSGGMRQRLGIAQAVIHKPSFVILDEPVSALDPIGRREVLDLIEKIKEETTIILSTHILSDAQEICNRFCILKKGKKVDDFYYADLQKKYTKNTLSIELREPNLDWIEYLKKLEFIDKVTNLNNSIYIEANKDKKDWSYLILESINQFKVEFLRIDVDKFSLEEYFMELVGETIA
ncbi:ABC transporter ATP-binding protein [Lactococcus paracarnosus]|uniref:ABC transporter ATP-binding protein n=1 Tax=Pseudolactococcus paracarnosus TaxID=2749962 RepID=A0A7L4WG44_9LACT|nr:ABC transporter ATP-binding protein [Lactococcus paracarnosus]SPC35285.1 ABC transporter-related protein [Lactococcus piscium]MCJ1978411.1 ABC transporter ATP-binding protein [Lactococcus paracarnosus]MCJ1984554.1 ABC transporter ATP-binding protein [Lactococcus paracarnosus]MCJ1994612.1 ABC transporter ATP-binding protein [Lactococcus paracarnosus]MCJ1999198.1 ABC transporter ATP-binding protein [Lactococcus paracarnosus]